MSDLFSHAGSGAEHPVPRPALAHRVEVPASREHAYNGFTEHVHLWWPTEQLSVWGEESFFDAEGGTLVETSTENEETVWADIVEADLGRLLRMIWHHWPGAADPTEVLITFADGADATRLSVTHGGWVDTEQSVIMREVYGAFWPVALARYARFMGGAPMP